MNIDFAITTDEIVVHGKKKKMYSACTFVLDQSRLWKFGELYGTTVAE
jgi:hypothetical protein